MCIERGQTTKTTVDDNQQTKSDMSNRLEDADARRHKIKFPTNTKDERVKLYGRNKELKRLRKCYSDLMQSPAANNNNNNNNKGVVFVSGVKGVGKTALVEEFLVQPFDRRRASARGGRNGNNNSSSRQQPLVIRCNFSPEQDGYQSWDEVHSTLREMALQQEASKDDDGDDDSSEEYLQIDDMLIESTSSGGQSSSRAATPTKIEDIPNSTSKESIHALLSIMCNTKQQQPSILFLDDCQNMSSTSLEVLSHLLFEELSLLGDLLIICAYSSTSNVSSSSTTSPLKTPFNEFLDRSQERLNHQILDASMISIGGGVDKTVEVINVYPLTLEVVTAYVADCSNRRDKCEVESLAEVIYDKTIGIISYVRSAMNELVAKSLLQNVVRADLGGALELCWIDDRISLGGALPNYLSGDCIANDVIHSIHTQIKEQLSLEVQRVLTMMACMPNTVFHSSMLCELLYLEESDVLDLLQHASSLLRISSSSTLTVSFSHEKIRQALLCSVSEEERNELVVRVFNSHFRKWREKRMHVREGHKAPKLRREMTALVAFFNVIDPSFPLTGDENMGALADSNISRSSHVSAASDTSNGSWESRSIVPVSKSLGHSLNDGRRRAGVRRNRNTHAKSLSFGALEPAKIEEVARTLGVDDTRGNATFSRLTSNEVPTNPFEKFISNRPHNEASPDDFKKLIIGKTKHDLMTPQLAPARRQKQALESIFFPFVSDPKSVLIQHGSVYLHSRHAPTVASDNGPCCKLENERELMIFSQGFIVADFPVADSYHLMMALTDGDAVTQESMMEYLRAKLVSDGNNISTAQLRDVLHEIAWPKYENVIRKLDPENKGQVNRKELHRGLEDIFSLPLSLSGSKERSAQFASLFSSVSRVDCLDISHSRDARSKAISHSSLAERSFSITLNDRDDDFVFTCLNQNHRDSVVSALRSGVLKAIEKSSSPDSTQMRKNRGWQHLIVRNSPISYVILNDTERLENILDVSRRNGDDAFGQIRFELSQLDENGYAAIHYACLLGRAQCVEILLEKGVSSPFTLDVRGLSPKDLACNDDVIKVLEKRRDRRPLTKSKRPSLSRGQSSFRRLRGMPKPRRSVSFADTDHDDSTRSLQLYTTDDESGEENEEHTTCISSMPNILRVRR